MTFYGKEDKIAVQKGEGSCDIVKVMLTNALRIIVNKL